MPAFIYSKSTSDDHTETVVMYWNRRKSEWQRDLTNSCIYPTFRGTARTARKLFNQWTDMRPHLDCVGAHCLEDFQNRGCNVHWL